MINVKRTLYAPLLLGAAVSVAVAGGGPGDEPSSLTAADVVSRAIAYHDPGGVWESGKVRLTIRTTYSEALAKELGSKSNDFELVLAPAHGQFG